MPNYDYKALTAGGQIVVGSVSATSAAEVATRVEYLGLILIDIVGETPGSGKRLNLYFGRRMRPEDVTIFSSDLALLLKSGMRLHDALEFLTSDTENRQLKTAIANIRSSVFGGESFTQALSHHSSVFPSVFIALVRVGEMSGTLDNVLDVIAKERVRAEALRRKIADALRYPAFVLIAALCVLLFFLMFVLPQFATVLRDFDAKLDPVISLFLGISDILSNNRDLLLMVGATFLAAMWIALRFPPARAVLMAQTSTLPVVRSLLRTHRTVLFCRNLAILLDSGVHLTGALRIIGDMMVSLPGKRINWSQISEGVRQGAKLSEALDDAKVFPPMAVRMVRLGEETGQLAALAHRVAEFYEAKLQRLLDRMVAITGPAAIVGISLIVGGLIVSVMTSLLSVTQIVG